MPLSAIVLTKNEEKKIQVCLTSLQFADEIIVIDDNSDDNTVEIAKKNRARVIQRSLRNNFADQRNVAMQQAQHDWILFIDADEQITQELKKEITNIAGNNTFGEVYNITRTDIFCGKELKWGEVWEARTKGFTRLMRKDSGVWVGAVHETYRTNDRTVTLRYGLKHFPHKSVTDFLKSVNYYSDIRARELLHNEHPFRLIELTIYPVAKFITSYFILLGLLDGARGFIYSFCMSFHSFLVRAKLYQFKYIDKS